MHTEALTTHPALTRARTLRSMSHGNPADARLFSLYADARDEAWLSTGVDVATEPMN